MDWMAVLGAALPIGSGILGVMIGAMLSGEMPLIYIDRSVYHIQGDYVEGTDPDGEDETTYPEPSEDEISYDDQ